MGAPVADPAGRRGTQKFLEDLKRLGGRHFGGTLLGDMILSSASDTDPSEESGLPVVEMLQELTLEATVPLGSAMDVLRDPSSSTFLCSPKRLPAQAAEGDPLTHRVATEVRLGVDVNQEGSAFRDCF